MERDERKPITSCSSNSSNTGNTGTATSTNIITSTANASRNIFPWTW